MFVFELPEIGEGVVEGEIVKWLANEGEFIDVFGTLDGWNQNEIATAATIVIRPNQLAEVDGKKPYADVRVIRAL